VEFIESVCDYQLLKRTLFCGVTATFYFILIQPVSITSMHTYLRIKVIQTGIKPYFTKYLYITVPYL